MFRVWPLIYQLPNEFAPFIEPYAAGLPQLLVTRSNSSMAWQGSVALSEVERLEEARAKRTITASSIGEWNARPGPARPGPDNALQHVRRQAVTRRVEGDPAFPAPRLRPMRGFCRAYHSRKGSETLRAIRRGDFDRCGTDVLNEIRFVRNLFDNDRKPREMDTQPPSRAIRRSM